MITAQTSIAEILEGWPQSVSLFVDKRLNCVGCAMSPFCTIREACLLYGLDLDSFILEIQTYQPVIKNKGA